MTVIMSITKMLKYSAARSRDNIRYVKIDIILLILRVISFIKCDKRIENGKPLE